MLIAHDKKHHKTMVLRSKWRWEAGVQQAPRPQAHHHPPLSVSGSVDHHHYDQDDKGDIVILVKE